MNFIQTYFTPYKREVTLFLLAHKASLWLDRIQYDLYPSILVKNVS